MYEHVLSLFSAVAIKLISQSAFLSHRKLLTDFSKGLASAYVPASHGLVDLSPRVGPMNVQFASNSLAAKVV